MILALLITTSCLSIQLVTGSRDFSFSNLDNSNLDVNYYFKRDCKCVKFKDCKVMISMVTKAQKADINYLYDRIRRSSCGFIDGQPLVCCPSHPNNPDHTYSIEIEDEPPWVWDSSMLYDNNYLRRNKKKVSRKFNYNFEETHSYGHEHNLVDFEDPRTRKNCPPTFFDGFEDEIDLGSRRKFIKPFDPHGYDSFDAKYGYPPPSGFRFSKLEPTQRPTPTPPAKSTTVRSIGRENRQPILNSEFCGVSLNTRIVGGLDSAPGQFPWIARVGYLNKTSQKITYRCAGSVISERYVITAAHCVTNLIDDLELSHIRIGEVQDKRTRDCEADPVLCRVPQDYNIERIIAHPNYDSPKYANDIALIRILKTDASVPLAPICLPFNNLAQLDEALVGRLAIIAGWRSNAAETGTAVPSQVQRKPTLQSVRLPIVNRTQCATTYAQFSANSWTPILIQQSQICVQGRENMDACQGDSGGPLMDDGSADNTNRFTLLGLVSFGPRTCGVSNFPGVYTKVGSFIDWIVANVQS